MPILPANLNRPLTVAEFLEKNHERWELDLIAGERGVGSVVTTAELNRPALALAGYFEVFSADRIQIIGLTESSYLRSLESSIRFEVLRKILAYKIPCILVTSGEDICPELPQVCNEHGTPLITTPQITSPLLASMSRYLGRRLAPAWSVHGVMMDVFGMGVLIQGKSGVGKSEAGLELVERGHRLISDDVVVLRRVGKNKLIAETPSSIGYHMEIRGIGIIDVELLFGVRAIREEAPVDLKITLEKWDTEKDYERLGIADHKTTLFECEIPEFVLPVEPGRNIAKLVEVAALTQRLEDQGINVAKEFDRRIIESIQSKQSSQSDQRLFTAIDRLHRQQVTGSDERL